ncbi:MAG: hypothetical protein JWO98_4018 [Frankiales bacterium]|nr:hypothetical protein [Frankiales bacterium]
MTASAQQLADYLGARFRGWPRDTGPAWLPRPDTWWPHSDRPTTDQLAAELLGDAEFAALRLGGWLGTDQGRLIAEALELVSPPFLRPDERLLQEALTLAARQQAQGNRFAGLFAVGTVAAITAAALLAIGTRSASAPS